MLFFRQPTGGIFFKKNQKILTLPFFGIKYDVQDCSGAILSGDYMDDNLIRDIGVAEDRAAEIVSSARVSAAMRLKEIEEDLAARASDLERLHRENKKEELQKASKAGEEEAAAIRSETDRHVETIKDASLKRKEEVIAFLIKKIME